MAIVKHSKPAYLDGVPYYKFNPDYMYDEELPQWIKVRAANKLKIPPKVLDRIAQKRQQCLF